jgi:hypothetical protein
MECFCEHKQAVDGVRATVVRKKGGQRVISKAKARTVIVETEIELITRRVGQKNPSKLTAPFIAKETLATVNAQCQSHNPPLGQFTLRSLTDAVRKTRNQHTRP